MKLLPWCPNTCLSWIPTQKPERHRHEHYPTGHAEVSSETEKKKMTASLNEYRRQPGSTIAPSHWKKTTDRNTHITIYIALKKQTCLPAAAACSLSNHRSSFSWIGSYSRDWLWQHEPAIARIWASTPVLKDRASTEPLKPIKSFRIKSHKYNIFVHQINSHWWWRLKS